jgi:alpha-D-ribose 1-methylphosphonate 5-triphosphate synthase subunit PhnG
VQTNLTQARTRRSELLARAEPAELTRLADDLLARHGTPEVTVPPETGLVMMQVREPVAAERFHLGEVVVSRAEVEWAGALGWSMRLGTDRGAALAAAMCDAAAELDLDAERQVLDLCERVERRLAAHATQEWTDLLTTQVTFEELD